MSVVSDGSQLALLIMFCRDFNHWQTPAAP
jgi:hypothetical protein